MRCWTSALLLGVVAGCATAPRPPAPQERPGGALCEDFVAAWVARFQANVARLDGQVADSREQALRHARQALARAGQDEDDCHRPYCIVRPKAGGRLDSYCGYRVADPAGDALYRWEPWAPARR